MVAIHLSTLPHGFFSLLSGCSISRVFGIVLFSPYPVWTKTPYGGSYSRSLWQEKVWYNWKAGGVGGDWIQLKDEFCLFFFPISKVIPHHMQLLSFKQSDESLGAVWARFMHIWNFGPPHGIQEEMLMQHFIHGLKPECAHFMNVTSEGSVCTRQWLK